MTADVTDVTVSIRRRLKLLVGTLEVLPTFDGVVAARTLAEIAARSSVRAKPRQPSVAFGLMKTGAIRPMDLAAAVEIARVFETIAGASGARCASYEPEKRTGGIYLPPELLASYRRYTAWRDAVGRLSVAGTSTVGDLVLTVVVDNLSLRETERRYRIRKGNALKFLRSGLMKFWAIETPLDSGGQLEHEIIIA